MIFPLLPRVTGAPVRRALFVEEGLQKVLSSPEGDAEWEKRVGELRADLEVFVTEAVFDSKYMFLLYPYKDAVWEIRSTRSNPSIRVLGLFAMKDVFIATNFALREDLGGWQSREWKQVKRKARATWRRLFNTYRPIVTFDIKQVATGALDDRYFQERARK